MQRLIQKLVLIGAFPCPFTVLHFFSLFLALPLSPTQSLPSSPFSSIPSLSPFLFAAKEFVGSV